MFKNVTNYRNVSKTEYNTIGKYPAFEWIENPI